MTEKQMNELSLSLANRFKDTYASFLEEEIEGKVNIKNQVNILGASFTAFFIGVMNILIPPQELLEFINFFHSYMLEECKKLSRKNYND